MKYDRAVKIAKDAIREQMKRYAIGKNLYTIFGAESQVHQYEKYTKLEDALSTLEQPNFIQRSFDSGSLE